MRVVDMQCTIAHSLRNEMKTNCAQRDVSSLADHSIINLCFSFPIKQAELCSIHELNTTTNGVQLDIPIRWKTILHSITVHPFWNEFAIGQIPATVIAPAAPATPSALGKSIITWKRRRKFCCSAYRRSTRFIRMPNKSQAIVGCFMRHK